MAVINFTFLVSDAILPVEDLLIGLLVLHHLCVESKTVVEEHWNLPGGVACGSVTTATTSLRSGKVGQLLMDQINRVANCAAEAVAQNDQDWPSVRFYKVRKEVDLFPDKSFFGTVDSVESTEVEAAIGKMLQKAFNNVFWKTDEPTFEK